MGRIILEDDNSLENVEIRLDHLLLDEKEIEAERRDYQPLTDLLDARFADFPPYLVSTGQLAKAAALIKGQDEVELFFLMILAGEEKSLVVRTLEKNREAVGEVFYQEMLCLAFLSAGTEERSQIMASILQTPQIIRTPFCSLVVALFSDEPQAVTPDGSLEQQAAFFVEALKAEKSDNIEKVFGDCLKLFTEGQHRFLFEYLRSLLMRYDTIPVPLVERFAETVLKSPLAVSFSSVKLLEFLYYWRNNLTGKFEDTVTALAEATDSLFILNAVAPLLYRYEKWHLLGKFYKLVARKTTGKMRVRYLELLADIYEHKLKMPDFATEIHKNIVEEDPGSCSISLSLVLSVYEENRQWEDLAHLYTYLAEREKEPRLTAYYLFRGGELLFRELGRPLDARPHLERSLKLHRSFEIIRLLSELYLRLQDFDAYIANLEQELEYAESTPERIALHDKIAEALISFKRAYGAAEGHFLKILELKPDRIETVKKLGKIYYITRNWEKLTGINSREVELSENTSDIVNLLYKNGTIYFNELHDYDRARQSFLHILSIVHHHIPSLLYLEKIYLRGNAVDEVIELYNSLLQSSTTDSETKEFYLTRLAIVYREQGRVKEAQDTFRLVEYLYPDSTIATENLRLLAGEAEFREFALDEFDDGELSSIVAGSGHDRQATAKLETAEPSLYKYLWEMRRLGESSVPDSGLDPAALNLRTILEGRTTADLLARHATRPAMLTLLAQHYLEKGHLKGIYTILAYYLKLNPEAKNILWSVFFMGADHPELKDKLESLLVTEKEMQNFEIALSILEKIYLREKDHRTILFLRTLFAKKLKDPASQRRFLDETIQLLTGHIEPLELLDLHKQRYRISEGADRDASLPPYRDLLVSLGMQDTLLALYEERWTSEGKAADGIYLLDLHLARRDADKATALTREILDRHPGTTEALDRLIDFLENAHRPQAANDVLRHYLADATRPDIGRAAAVRLMRTHLRNGNIAEAVSLFHGIPFTDTVARFSDGIDLAERILGLNQSAFAAQIAHTLRASSPDEALRKTALLFHCGDRPSADDLGRIGSYAEVRPIAESGQNPAAALDILYHFATRRDPQAIETLAKRLIEEQRTDEARRLLLGTGTNAQDSDILRSLALRLDGRAAEEKELLSQALLDELRRGDTYPAERLVELASPANRRASFFLQNLLAALRVGHARHAENEWHHLSAMRENIIFAQAGFTALDMKLQAFGRLLAIAVPSPKAPARRAAPLTAATSRDLSALVEKLSLALRTETLPVFFDGALTETVAIDHLNVPALVLGPGAEKTDRKRTAFLLASSYFLVGAGVTERIGRKGVESLVERLLQVLPLSGKDRLVFLRSVRRKHLEEVTAFLNELGTPAAPVIRTFGERLHLASLLYAFTVIPDIAQVCASADESLDHLDAPDSATANAYALAMATFFE